MKKISHSLESIARVIEAEIFNPAGVDLSTKIEALAPLTAAGPGHITFLSNPQFKKEACLSKATAIITRERLANTALVQMLHPHPQVAMAKTSQLFNQPKHSFQGQSPLAHIADSAVIDPSATIYPFAFVGPHAQIGAHCVVYPHCYVGEYCEIAEHTVLYPGVVLMDHTQIGQEVIIHAGAVLGADGFGFAPGHDKIHKIPQIGRVVVEDQVEIGPLVTIDRATFDQTIIRHGAKLDSQVHVGHNSEVGEQSMLCGQVGIAGSVKLGKRCIAAGQSGISQGLTVGDGVILGAKSALLQSESLPGEYIGIPAVPAALWRRQTIAQRSLPELLKQVRLLQKTRHLDK